MADVNPMVGNCKYAKLIASEIRKHFGAPKSIVELGCGCGKNLAEFSDAIFTLGIDPLLSNVRTALASITRGNIILGNHDVLNGFADGMYDVGFTCSVLDHIENFETALRGLCRVSRKVMLFEPYINGVDRKALETETSCWKTTWYHNYEFILNAMEVPYDTISYPLYSTDSGPLFHQFIIDSEQYDAKVDS